MKEMKSSYHVEIWDRYHNFEKICKTVNLSTPKNPRSIIKCFTSEVKGPPNIAIINQMYDKIEELMPDLQALKVERKDLSIWVECEQQASFELYIDPMTLLDLGYGEMKLCLSSWDNPEIDISELSEVHKQVRTVDIDEIWIEAEERKLISAGHPFQHAIPGSSEVIVRFDDKTFWIATFMTYEHIEGLISMRREKGMFFPHQYKWIPNLILVDELERENVEKIIIDLLINHSFENAFSQIDTGQSEEEDMYANRVQAELNIIHENNLIRKIEDILETQKGEILVKPNFWTFKNIQLTESGHLNQIYDFLDLLTGKYEQLFSCGIHRKDITLNWKYFHKGNCNIELSPELMMEIGKNGLTLGMNMITLRKGFTRQLD